MNDLNPGAGWRKAGEREIGPDDDYIAVSMRQRGQVRHDYYVPDDPVPLLPSEPGYYVPERPNYGGGAVVVELLHSPTGQWVDAGDRQYLVEADVVELGTLVRLEPRAITAKAVLERVRENGFGVPGAGGIYDKLALEFGVKS